MSNKATTFKIIQAGLLVLICAVIFSNTFKNDFVWDDLFLIVDNQHIKKISNIPLFFTGQYWRDLHPFPNQYRPIRTSTFATDYFLWELNPFGYHLTNLLLHMANVLLVFCLGTMICRQANVIEDQTTVIGRIVFQAPFLAALFFATHPVHTESVTFIKNRSDLLASLFFLMAFLLFMKQFTHDKNRFDLFFTFGSWLCFLLALFSKEIALTLPLIMVLYAFCFFDKKELVRTFFQAIPYCVLAMAFFLFRLVYINVFSLAANKEIESVFQHMMVVCKTIGGYIKLLLLPVNLSANHLFVIPESLWDKSVLLSIIFLLLLVIISVKLYRHSKILFFCVGWVILTLLPVANIIFLESRPVAEQRLYLPSFGVCLLLAVGFNNMYGLCIRHDVRGESTRILALSMLFVVVLYSALTFNRNTVWRNNLTLSARTLADNPYSPGMHTGLGLELAAIGRFAEAVHHYQISLRVEPDNAVTHNNLGIAYYRMGRFEEALAQFKTALDLDPGLVNALNNLSLIAIKRQRWDQAFDYIQAALKLKPDSARAHVNFGILSYEKAEYEKSQILFSTAVQLEPDNIEILNSIGDHYREQGQIDKAIRYYTMAAGKSRDNADAHYCLGEIMSDRKQFTAAIDHYQQALRIKPFFTAARINLGVTLAQAQMFDAAIKHFYEALELDPDNAMIHNNLGLSLANSGRLNDAIEHYRLALRINPDYVEAHNNISMALAITGQASAALEHCLKAIRLDPVNATAYFQAGNLYLNEGETERAVSYFSKALEINPEDANYHNNLGVALIWLGQGEQALDHFQKALQIMPDYTAARFNLGSLLYDRGEYEKAADYFFEILQKNPGHRQAKSKYENCLIKMGPL